MSEEIDEMITILKAIQKRYREVSVLVNRAKVMCPEMMDWQSYQMQPLRTLLDSTIPMHTLNAVEPALKQQLQQLEAQKQKEQAIKEHI